MKHSSGGRFGWLWVGLWFVSSALAQGPCAIDYPHDSNPTPINDQDVCNFHRIDAEAYRGGRPRPSAFPKFAAFGIRTVVDLEEAQYAEQERSSVEKFNATVKPERRIQFVSFPISQTEIEMTGLSPRQVRSLFTLIHEAPKPVFIHCFLGKDRTGAISAIYRLVREEKSFQEAYDEAVHYKFSQFDFGLKRTMERYKSPKNLSALPRP